MNCFITTECYKSKGKNEKSGKNTSLTSSMAELEESQEMYDLWQK